MANIIAIDPSFSDLGWALNKTKSKQILYGHKRTYSRWPDSRRVKEIFQLIKDKIQEHDVQEMVWEKPKKFTYYGRKTSGVRTFLAMGMSIAACLLPAPFVGIDDYGISPQDWKGRASKQQTIQQLIYRTQTNNDRQTIRVNNINYEVVGNRINKDMNNNAADALAILLFWLEQGELIKKEINNG